MLKMTFSGPVEVCIVYCLSYKALHCSITYKFKNLISATFSILEFMKVTIQTKYKQFVTLIAIL